MNPQLKQSWIAALRGGNYLQGRGCLRERSILGTARFCAMGVLLDLVLATPTHWGRLTRATSRIGLLDEAVGYLPAEICAQIGISSMQQALIAGLNDQGRSFEQIAEVIERDFEDEVRLRKTASRLTGGLLAGGPYAAPPPSPPDWSALAGDTIEPPVTFQPVQATADLTWD